MKAINYVKLLLLFAVMQTLLSSFSVYDVACEHEESPLGVETQHPKFSWKIAYTGRDFVQTAWQIVVSGTADGGEELWNSGKVASAQSLHVAYGGKALQPCATYYYKVRVWDAKGNVSRWSPVRRFSMGLFSSEDWGGAKWIALQKDNPAWHLVPAAHGTVEVGEKIKDSAFGAYRLPQFRKVIDLKKGIRRAYAYVTGLGQFDFFINGSKVDNHFLDPGWTSYEKEALYVTFDVTRQLHSGENVLGVMLGNGFYNIPYSRYFKIMQSYGAPKLCMLLRVEYEDGTVARFVTDKSWRVTESPITYSSIYGGENYDASRYQTGWMQAGFDDAAWQRPVIASYTGRLTSQRSTPITVHQMLSAVRVFKNKAGWVYDLGQNCSGIVRLRLRSKGRQTVVLRPAELLNADSTVNQSASGQPYYWSYTSRGDSLEEWQPQFTYYGFRYVQVEGAVPEGKAEAADLPEVCSLRGLHTCNSAPEAGTFECSKPLFNQIFNLIDWAIRSNLASVVTDCPHREKLGWLEQVHLMQHSMQYRYDLSRMYAHALHVMSVSQRTDGCIPSICPEYVRFSEGFEDSPEWGSAFILSTWYYYRFYGDEQIIRGHYEDMKRYLAYLGSRSKGRLLDYGLGDWYDLGPNEPGYAQLTSRGLTATAMYYYDANVLGRMARLLGHQSEADSLQALQGEIKRAFLAKYWNRETRVMDRNSQTANALCLFLGLVNEEDRPTLMDRLVTDIRSRGNALTAGDVGYRYVLQALVGQHSDVIFDMNSRYDVPGYGWQLAHGATALTESWQAYGFVSNNHLMLGHLMEWFFSGLGGIRQAESSVAFRQLVFDPQVVGDVTSARTTYETPYGRVSCEWRLHEGEYTLRVSVPAGCTAEVVLPAADSSKVTEYGVPLSAAEGVHGVEAGPVHGKLRVRVGSGDYEFCVTGE